MYVGQINSLLYPNPKGYRRHTMARINKFLYGFKIQGNYGQGWEDECFEETRKEARQRLREYQENSPYPSRMVQAREPNPAHPDNQQN